MPLRQAGAGQDQEAIRTLLTLIDQRLALAPLVARAKWNSGAPIDDPQRERQILDAVAQQALHAGVDPAYARRFFQDQFDAGKTLQRALHAQWRRTNQPRFDDVPDLARDVRPVLDRLTPQLIDALKAVPAGPGGEDRWRHIEEQARQLIRADFDGLPRAAALGTLLGN
jgi:chorismate mutase